MVIETFSLTKVYPGGEGCREITLSVGEGEVFGLLGPNGTGKSTFVKALVGLVFPSAGQARILDRSLGNVTARRQIGFLPENFRYHDWLTARELLQFHGTLHGLAPQELRHRIPEVLELVGLERVEKKKIKTFSKGMQQRIGLAVALLPRPRLLFLDELTSALDPLGRKEIREIIQHLQNDGVTVFLNSHLLSEVERVCNRVAFIKEGSLVAAGRLDELLVQGTEVTLWVGNLNSGILQQLQQLGSGLRVQDDRVTLQVRGGGAEDVPALAVVVVRCGGKLYSLEPKRNSLEDLFVEIVEGNTPATPAQGDCSRPGGEQYACLP